MTLPTPQNAPPGTKLQFAISGYEKYGLCKGAIFTIREWIMAKDSIPISISIQETTSLSDGWAPHAFRIIEELNGWKIP